MRSWTLAFLAVAALLVIAGGEDFRLLLAIGAGIPLTLVAVSVLIAGMHRLALQRLREVEVRPPRRRGRLRRIVLGVNADRADRPDALLPLSPAQRAGDGRTR